MLKRIKIKNFKSIRECEFDLTPVTLLVGANNSGKSSVLQALHFAATLMRQASEANKQSTIPISSVEYLPSEHYRKLSRGDSEWGNVATSHGTDVSFSIEQVRESLPGLPKVLEHTASITIKAARNEGLSLSPVIPQGPIFSQFRRSDTFYTAYIPGLAGVPLQESYLTKRHVFRKVASGDSNIVLRNILLMIYREGKLKELLEHVNSVYSNVDIKVEFDEKSDFYINSEISISSSKWIKKPLEFAGTGILQVIQVFSYLILFRPKLLLIDEPESHLHPTLQTKLIREVAKKVNELGAAAIITTHSPFVARGLPIDARTVWLENGRVVASTSGGEIKEALGWGAIDRKVILCSEDGNVGQLESILAQDESIYDKVSVMPFSGVSKLGNGKAVMAFKEALGNAHEIIVHRDRDCMSDEELRDWTDEVTNHGLIPWVTKWSDIEAYFCTERQIATALDISKQTATQIRETAFIENEEKLLSEFQNKRKEVNKKVYEKTGGSPNIENLWNDWSLLEKVKGKTLLSKLRSVAKAKGYDEKKLGRCAKGDTVAPDLFQLIENNI